jgi:hypothetical protein
MNPSTLPVLPKLTASRRQTQTRAPDASAPTGSFACPLPHFATTGPAPRLRR